MEVSESGYASWQLCSDGDKHLNVRIRKATRNDSKDLLRLADELIHLDDWSGREVTLEKTVEDPNCSLFVAETPKKVVGFIELRVFPDFTEGALIAIIQNLVVEKDFRGVGVGSKLVERAVEEVEKQHVIEIHVWTEFENQQAIDFYNKLGFKKRYLLLERNVGEK